MASFIEKLRLDNLYPRVPIPSSGRKYQLYNDFLGMQGPPQLDVIAEQAVMPRPTMEEPQKPMDVVYQPSIGDIGREMAYARDVHGIDLSKGSATEYQQGQLALRAKQLEQQERTNQGKQDIAERRAVVAEKNAEISAFRAQNPQAKIVAQKGGNLVAINPVTGTTIRDFGSSGLYTDEEAANVANQNKLGQIAATGEEARKTEGVRQEGKETLEDIKARHEKELKEFESKLPARPSASAGLPSQERTGLLQRAEQARNTNPEWAKYIKVIPGGGFMVTAPGRLFGPSQETYDAINKFIYSEPAPAPAAPTPTPTSPERIRVKRKSDGSTGTILASDFDANKYDKVQ